MTRTWATRIKEARKRGFFTVEDVKDALDWNRCAVGERADWNIPLKGKEGQPDLMNDALTKLGRQFTSAVAVEDIVGADRLLKSIHRVMRGEDP